MSRGLASLVLIGIVGLSALATAPAPNAAARQPFNPPLPLPDLLNKLITYEGVDDPKATLMDLLEQQSKIHRVTFVINEDAFKAEKVFQVEKTEVASPPIPRLERVRFRTVLDRILQRVPVPSGVTYLLRSDHIEITTGKAARREVFRGWDVDAARPLPVLVHADFRRVPLDIALETLSERSDRTVLLDPAVDEKKVLTSITLRLRNTPVDTAAQLVARAAGLSVVELDNVLLVTTAEKAATAAKEHAARRPVRSSEAKPPPAGDK